MSSRVLPGGAWRRGVRRLGPLMVAAGLMLAAFSVPSATVAQASGGNPLAGRPWGVYKGPMELAWGPYASATGANKALLAKIALRPKAAWFGPWFSDDDIAARTHEYIANSQAGNPNALVQMTVFRAVPWEQEACKRLPTAAEQASYKLWTDRMAGAIGSTPTVIILQPDGPFALCAPGHSLIPSSLIAYSARVFSALPHTSVYIEAGAADWPAPGRQGGVNAAVQILLPAGIRYARGVALNGTHYSATTAEIVRGAAIVQALAARGIPGKHVVINTSSAGHPFEFGKYRGSDPDNANVCRSAMDTSTCVKLGPPPTADVANRRFKLAPATARLARAYVDAYMWFGRPWLYRQAAPFDMNRALQLARTAMY